jgi:DNA repair photolyase
MNSIWISRVIRGRGARANVRHRFQRRAVIPLVPEDEEAGPPKTEVTAIRARSIITRNQSPDVGFDLSVNPYQGCEHGCVYCFARPSHAYHDLSPGLDFETKILAKTNAVELFREELGKPNYRCEPIAIGVNTDAYQPAERKLKITRGLLQACLDFGQPALLITKSALILRDTDLLAELATQGLVRVSVSVTTLDNELKRILEPRTAGPAARLKIIRHLSEAGVPVSAMVAPVIPRINDHEMEHILESVKDNGALSASYVLLRLPHEVEPLFRDWLASHYPDRAEAVMRAIASCRGGKSYDARFHTRMKGEGLVAEMISQRFRLALKNKGLDGSTPPLRTDRFNRPTGTQFTLF